MAASPSITYCTGSPARIMAVVRENIIVIRSFGQPSATTVSQRIAALATITVRSAA